MAAAMTVEALQAIMDKPDNIRNWTIIGTVDHGRIILQEVLDEKAGVRLADSNTPPPPRHAAQKEEDAGGAVEGERRSGGILLYHRELLPEPDPPEEENIRGRSSGGSPDEKEGMPNVPEVEPEEYVHNLIDSQGYAEYSTDVSSALRISDGALIVVDCIQGMAFETESGLRQALGERIKPVMAINKLEQGFLELQLDWEMFYSNFSKQIELVNNIIDNYRDDVVGDMQLHPAQGSVAFTAGSHHWGFTLPQFARFYSKKFKIPEDKMCERLWGDYFFIPKEKQWKRSADSQFRAFSLFVLDPIGKIFSACMNDQMEKLNKMLVALGFKMKKQDLEYSGKELLKRTMRTWLPIDRALLDMITRHSPSPVVAQKYRAALLYSGPADEADECFVGIRDCDPQAPLILYISKMVKAADKGRFIAFGRVFAGSAASDTSIRIMGPNYQPGKKDHLFARKKILGMTLFAGRRQEPVERVGVGNTCCLTGIDNFLTSAGTLSTSNDAWPIRELTRSTSAVVRCAIEPVEPENLPKLMEALRGLRHVDRLVQIEINESGQLSVSGTSELHLESMLDLLTTEFLSPKECPLKFDDLVVSYKETVTAAMKQACISLSPNKLNCLAFKATPISEDVSKKLENGEITFRGRPDEDFETLDDETEIYSPDHPLKMRKSVAATTDDLKRLMSQVPLTKRIEMETARKVWAFGPGEHGTCILLDATSGGSASLNEIKDSIVASFAWVTKEGVLCEENMRGIGLKIADVALHRDAFLRGTGQILPTARRVMYAAQMLSQPRLMEPVYLVDITCSEESIDDVEMCIERRRGEIFDEVAREGTVLRRVTRPLS